MRSTKLILPESLNTVVRDPAIPRVLVVGGAVRDWLIGLPPKDVGLECYGLPYSELARVLARHGKVDLVGKHFGICKLTIGGVQYDFNIPRCDAKTGIGIASVESDIDPALTPAKAALRRDFTINAIAYDPRTFDVLDFHGGFADLRDHVIRHTSDKHFAEDPLRPLRAFQLAARLDFVVAPETTVLCRQIRHSYHQLPRERVREEWLKWAAKSVRPSRGLEFLHQSGYLQHFPLLADLVGTPQNPKWHPEGDVWTHTKLCCDSLAESPEWESRPAPERAVLMMAMLAHDIAKPPCTKITDPGTATERITSLGHERKGGTLALEFLSKQIGIEDRRFVIRVQKLVANHKEFTRGHDDERIRRASARLAPENLANLELVVRADYAARPPLPRDMPETARCFFARADELGIKHGRPEPFLLGRHLIDAGMKPGPQFKVVLAYAYELQLQGHLRSTPDAKNWLLLNRTGLESVTVRASALINSSPGQHPER